MTALNNKMNPEKSSSSFFKIDSILDFQLFYILIFLGFALFSTIISRDYFLKWAEELSLFSSTSQYFSECMRFAGGMLIYDGTFLTQFFYHPLLGSLIYIAILLIIQYLSISAFRIPWKYYPLSFIPGLMLLLSITQLGYVWITLKSPGYFYSNALGIIVFLLCFIGYKNLNNRLSRSAALLIMEAIGYPLFGFYALFAGIICLLHESILFFKDKDIKHFVPVITGIILIGLIPQIYYYHVFNYMQYVHIYIAGLPRFAYNIKELTLWLPFIILFLSFLAFTAFVLVKPEENWKDKNAITLSTLVFVSAIVFTYFMSYEDENFKAEVKMNAAIDRNDWKKVITIARNLQGPPTKNIVLNYEIALSMLHKAENAKPDLSNTIKPKSLRPSTPIFIHMNNLELLYITGRTNDCYHWCMEDMVEYGIRISYLKYMVKCAIINEEYSLANKYNKVLSNTLFYKNWAQKYQTYMDNPQLAKSDKEIMAIRQLMTTHKESEIEGNDF